MFCVYQKNPTNKTELVWEITVFDFIESPRPIKK